MTALDSALIDELLAGQLDLLRFEAGVRARIMVVLTRMQRELTAKLHEGNLTEFSKARTEALLKQATSTIERYYTVASGTLSESLRGSAEATAVRTKGAFDVLITTGATLPTETFMSRIASNVLIFGASSAEWWSKQSTDIAFRFGNAVRQGMTQGETNEQIVARIAGSPRKGIPGIMEIARSNARSLVHTSIQAVANEARLETFRKNSDVIVAIRWLATLDSHTCAICGARDGQEYTLNDDPPKPVGHKLTWDGGPGVIHWGCRCVATPITRAYKDRPPQGQRASADGPIPAKVDFEAFLKRKGTAFSDEVLGPGRAELWRKGKLSLEQLLSLDGTRIMSVAALKARFQ